MIPFKHCSCSPLGFRSFLIVAEGGIGQVGVIAIDSSCIIKFVREPVLVCYRCHYCFLEDGCFDTVCTLKGACLWSCCPWVGKIFCLCQCTRCLIIKIAV